MNFKVTFEREVEPGIIKILDMDLYEIQLDSQSLRRRCLRIVSLRDNEFIVDQTTFDEIIDSEDYMDEKVDFSQLELDLQKKSTMYQN